MERDPKLLNIFLFYVYVFRITSSDIWCVAEMMLASQDYAILTLLARPLTQVCIYSLHWHLHANIISPVSRFLPWYFDHINICVFVLSEMFP